jgi:hypothetical protein
MSRVAQEPAGEPVQRRRRPGSPRRNAACRPPRCDRRRGQRSTTGPCPPPGLRRVAGRRPADDKQHLAQDIRRGTITGVVSGVARVFVVWLAEHGHLWH